MSCGITYGANLRQHVDGGLRFDAEKSFITLTPGVQEVRLDALHAPGFRERDEGANGGCRMRHPQARRTLPGSLRKGR